MTVRYERNTSSYDRALGFFDAVYGFALTLLVTTIDVSHRDAWLSLGGLLGDHGSELLAFLISFVVIVIFWRRSHTLLGRLVALDATTILANVVVIGCIVFIPFTTEAMGHPELQDLPLPTAAYAFNLGAAMLASIAMYQIARRRGLVEDGSPPRVQNGILAVVLLQPAVMFASIPVAYLSVALWGEATAAQLFWLLLVVPVPWARRLSRRDAADQPSTAGS